MAKPSVSMKLYIDTQAKRVLFAEANKDSVDFLFSMLSLPVPNTLLRLKKLGTVGSLVNHYETLKNPSGDGFVKRSVGVTYIVMDNLVVEPMYMSISTCIALLHRLKVKDFNLLEEKALTLLKASLQSDNVLTDVFLSGKPALALEEPKELNRESMESFGAVFMQYEHVVPAIVCSMLLEGKIEFTPEIRRELLHRIRSDKLGDSEWVVVDP